MNALPGRYIWIGLWIGILERLVGIATLTLYAPRWELGFYGWAYNYTMRKMVNGYVEEDP